MPAIPHMRCLLAIAYLVARFATEFNRKLRVCRLRRSSRDTTVGCKTVMSRALRRKRQTRGLVRACKHHPALGRVAGDHALARLDLSIERDAADRCFRLFLNLVF